MGFRSGLWSALVYTLVQAFWPVLVYTHPGALVHSSWCNIELCTGVRWDLLVATAGLGFQEEASGRPGGNEGGSPQLFAPVSNQHLSTHAPGLSFKPSHLFWKYLFRSYILSFDFHWMGDDVWGGRPMIGQWIGETQDKVADTHLDLAF